MTTHFRVARLYLSRRTAQFHVSSILAKLRATSRVELAAVVIRHTPPAADIKPHAAAG